MITKVCKVCNLYGGPGTGKSTTAASLFSILKYQGVNCEYVQEYAKDKAWEFGKNHAGVPKVFQAQEYIFGKQHFRFRRCAEDVDIIIADSPLLLGLNYMPDDFPIPSLRGAIREAYDMYDNLNVFLKRVKPYNPKGRFQTEDESKVLDITIKKMLDDQGLSYLNVEANQQAPIYILREMINRGWIGVISSLGITNEM